MSRADTVGGPVGPPLHRRRATTAAHKTGGVAGAASGPHRPAATHIPGLDTADGSSGPHRCSAADVPEPYTHQRHRPHPSPLPAAADPSASPRRRTSCVPTTRTTGGMPATNP
ncbi:hypothetical protein ABT009_05365 [Streptomyces sp. NPDC002896]|uniref:hypothetical protein n=1 Tax=Streptomyces sp. NPDC002896 TaxID=3154438 RepID=UPI0033254D82